MKKVKFLFFAVCAIVMAACDLTHGDISFSEDIITMKVGDIRSLDVTSSSSDLEWKSSDEKVVTVFEGTLMAVGVGYANVTVIAGKAQAMCVVYVTEKDGTLLSLSPQYVEVEKGEEFQYEFSSTYDVPLELKSSNEEVAEIDATGKVIAKKAGVSIISLSNGVETKTSVFAVKHVWGDYHLVWSDEFDGTSIDDSNWNIEVNGAGGGNQEKQYYTDRPENIRVEDGNLILELRKESYQNRDYTSGRMQTRGKRQFKYGRIEARISFPSGGGTWPAFWMLGNGSWPSCGEIDIIEHVGNQPRMLSFALHTKERNGMSGNNWSSRSYFDGVENEYHVYAVEWMEEENCGCDVIKFMYDGEVCATRQEDINRIDDSASWPFNKEHYIILNLAIGGTMGGKIDDSMFETGSPVQMKVDWVRVYQREEK